MPEDYRISLPNSDVIKNPADETPSSRVSRVHGILDALTVSTGALVLRLEDGRVLRGVVNKAVLNNLKDFLGDQVVVEGLVTFRPSGEALSIEVESVKRATAADPISAQSADAGTGSVRALEPAGELDALFGKWPGDETDEELARALRDLS